MDYEKREYVTLVDSIEFFVDSKDTQGHKFLNLLQTRALGYVVFLVQIWCIFWYFWVHVEVHLGLQK